MLVATDEPIWYCYLSNSGEYRAGVTPVRNTTVFSPELYVYHSHAEADLVRQLGVVSSAFPPLPEDSTAWLEAGELYTYGDSVVKVRVSHYRTPHPPEETNLFVVWREDSDNVLEWVPREEVVIGTKRKYGGVIYVALMAHVTEPDWTPPATLGVLWKEYVVGIPNWQPGSYDIDILVSHIGRVWKSLMTGNTGEPGVIGTWRDQSDPPLWVVPAGTVGLWHMGDIVEYNGRIWRSEMDNNVYEPGVFGWEDIGLLEEV